MTIEENKSLKEYTTFRIGGSARFFCIVKSEKDLEEAVFFAKERKVPFFILGGGSNILISDEGFSGLVIKMEMKGLDFLPDENGNMKVTVKAGEDWDEFVEECVKRGLYGVENLSYIPGTVGATPVQNIGAYGSEVKDTIDFVRVFDTKEGKYRDMPNVDCHFSYRNSIFKKEKRRFIITAVVFVLKKDGSTNISYKDLKEYFAKKGIANPNLSEVRDAVIEIRKNKLPDIKEFGTAGSFFKNPFVCLEHAHALKAEYPDMPVYPVNDEVVKVSLGWVLDHICKYKGVAKGDVGTYKNQALVIVNNGNATACDIRDFADGVSKVVKEKTGIEIEPEVEYVGL